jgi:hypothetical protein
MVLEKDISWTDRVRNDALCIVQENWNILPKIRRKGLTGLVTAGVGNGF